MSGMNQKDPSRARLKKIKDSPRWAINPEDVLWLIRKAEERIEESDCLSEGRGSDQPS